MITYKNGNLLETNHVFIAHGCNLKGVMGAGIALQIKDKWPAAFREYKQACDKKTVKLGDVVAVHTDGRVIYNALTQKATGRGRQVDYKAVRSAFEWMFENMKSLGCQSDVLAIPKIGAGLGGGDWAVIEEIIREVSNKHNMNVVVYEFAVEEDEEFEDDKVMKVIDDMEEIDETQEFGEFHTGSLFNSEEF